MCATLRSALIIEQHGRTLAWLRCPSQMAGTRADPDLSVVCTAQKEEADSQSIVPSRQLSEDKTDDEAAPEQGDNGSTDAMENGIGLKPENRSTPRVGGDAHSPRSGTGTRARGGISIAGPTPASSEGSGDLDLVIEVNSGVSVLPQSSGEDRDYGAPRGIPVEGAMTAGRQRAPTTGGAGDEGSGEAIIPGQGQEVVIQGTETGGAALTSVTEKMEDVQVDAEGVDEYAYIPDSGSFTVTHGKAGSTAGVTSFTQISPDKDDEVNIFIGRANIHVGEQENTQAGNGNDDDGIPAQRRPEVLATTATPSPRGSTTTSPTDGHPTGDDEDGAPITGDGEGPVAPSPWRVTGSDITVPAKGEAQKFKGRPGHMAAATTPHQGGDKEATATVPAKGASIRLGTTIGSPGVSKGDCTTTSGTAGGRKASESARGRGEGSGEVGSATPQPHREGRPGAGARVQQGRVGQEKTPRMDKVPSPHRKAGSQAPSGAQASAGGRGGDTAGRPHGTKVGGTPPPQAGQAGASMAVGEGRQRGQSGKSGVVVAGADDGRLPGHHGRRLGAGAPGAFAALGHSRQLDQVKRANELHVRERSFYTLGGAAGGPRGPYIGLGSADSSQSSEGERGSRSDSRQTGLRPSGWGAPGHSHGRWSRATL
uniref:Uncharacterized protein n=1 Tax=Calidris pygmaea TaxID=425635 RepID=A0A8C3PTZ5_9CHAR